jgi:2,3-bisphosphoglycerate-dependent phosphoglycerate mutase
MTASGTLIIARHHESEWNKHGLWTGTRDVHLTPYGFEKSEDMGRTIQDVHIDIAFASMQTRSLETLSRMLAVLELSRVPIERSRALNERDYGDYTGKNKWEMKKLVGDETFERMRRDWNCPIPHGETLKTVYERVVPFYQNIILPVLLDGKNALIVSHGNALRALMVYIESIPTDETRNLEMLFGAVIIYKVDENGCMVTKEIRQT